MDDKKTIFKQLRLVLKKFAKGMEVRKNTAKAYELYGKKKVTFRGRDCDAIYFATAIIQKNFVGFYFFPIYTHPREFKGIPPELKKCLKGKSCFHVKKNDKKLFGQIRNILTKGRSVYKRAGWI